MMHTFHDFDDFRVVAWMDDVFVRVVDIGEAVKNTVTKAIASAVVATALVGAAVLSVPATAVAAPVVTSGIQSHDSSLLHAELRQMSAVVEDKLEKLSKVSVDSVDSDLLSLARLALVASSQRMSQPALEVAEAFFADAH